MKKQIVYLLFILTGLALMSNERGRGAASGTAVTGAPGESTCGQPGCHSSGSFSPSLNLDLIDEDGVSVTNYLPGETYTVALSFNTVGFPGGYGFQMVCLTDGNESVNSFSNFPQDVGEIILNQRQYVEQSARLPTDSIAFSWTAPVEGTGNVTFYSAGNAVNGTGGTGGDGVATIAAAFPEGMVSSTTDLASEELELYPNPVNDVLTIGNDIQIQELQIIDQSGKLVTKSTTHQCDVSSLNHGLYVCKVLTKDGQNFARLFNKI